MKTTTILTKALPGLRRCDTCKRRQMKCLCSQEEIDLDRIFLDEVHKTASVNLHRTCISNVECKFTMKRSAAYESDAETVGSIDSIRGSDADSIDLLTPKITERKISRTQSGSIIFERKNSNDPLSLEMLSERNQTQASPCQKNGVSPHFIFVE